MSAITDAPALRPFTADPAADRAASRPRVLLLRALGLGDFLTGVPAYRAVRRAFPEHEVVLAAPAQFAPLAELTGAIDRLLPTDELAPVRWPWPYDAPQVAVDLHGNGPASRRLLEELRPAQLIGFSTARAPNRGVCHLGPRWLPGEHEVYRWCRLLTRSGIPADPSDLELQPPDPVHRPASSPKAASTHADSGSDSRSLSGSVAGTGTRTGTGTDTDSVSGPDSSSRTSTSSASATGSTATQRPWPANYARPVIIHPGAGYPSRRWPPARFAAVAGYLNKSGWRVLITGSPSERDLAEYVARTAGLPPYAAVAGQTTPLNLAALVAEAALVVSGDTGIAHLATAFRRPSVVLFGPIPPDEWGPPPDRPWHVALHAAEPGYHGDPHGDQVDPALDAIRATDVIAAVDKLLEATNRPGG
jgi:ADP-heptose:LPS heptosyltransferase